MGLLCSVKRNRFSLALEISCKSSCGLTWPLNAFGFHIFRINVPSRITFFFSYDLSTMDGNHGIMAYPAVIALVSQSPAK